MEEKEEERQHFGISNAPVRVIREFNAMRALAGQVAPAFLEELLCHYQLNHQNFKLPQKKQPAPNQTPQTSGGIPETIIAPSSACQRDILDTLESIQSGKEQRAQNALDFLAREYLKPSSNHTKIDIEAVRAFLDAKRPAK